jgi:hypothetical protein
MGGRNGKINYKRREWKKYVGRNCRYRRKLRKLDEVAILSTRMAWNIKDED